MTRIPAPARRPAGAADAALQQARALLGGLSPAQFMRRHWQRRPLLIRQALPPQALGGLDPATLTRLAARPEIGARLIQRSLPAPGRRRPAAAAAPTAVWQMQSGPFRRGQIPPIEQPAWTLLVQGLDRHLPAARALLDHFDFLPAARLDDLMVSWASDGGGVGPHVDSYDVFLLQLDGRRRWRVAPPGDESRVPGLPLKILQHFEPTEDWLLEPGDMLYLPPGWGHDGVAEGPCRTASIGFRAPARDELAQALMARLLEAAAEAAAEAAEDADGGTALPAPVLYRDPGQPATPAPGRIPPALQAFALDAVHRQLHDPRALALALGECLSEPAADADFHPAEDLDQDDGAADEDDDDDHADAPPAPLPPGGLRLAPGSRMLYDDRHIFLNGESWRAAGRDARLMQALADRRSLGPAPLARASAAARALLRQWLDDGWLLPGAEAPAVPAPPAAAPTPGPAPAPAAAPRRRPARARP